jgi:hypothetical protein
VRKLPGRVWKLPRREDDEAAEESIGRILALSDGVFAIAITLLILEIAVPATTSDAGLPKALPGLWPRYLVSVVSFLVITRFWMTLGWPSASSPATTPCWRGSTCCCSCSQRSCHFPPLLWERTPGRPQWRFYMRPRCAWHQRPPRPTGGTHPAREAC